MKFLQVIFFFLERSFEKMICFLLWLFYSFDWMLIIQLGYT